MAPPSPHWVARTHVRFSALFHVTLKQMRTNWPKRSVATLFEGIEGTEMVGDTAVTPVHTSTADVMGKMGQPPARPRSWKRGSISLVLKLMRARPYLQMSSFAGVL